MTKEILHTTLDRLTSLVIKRIRKEMKLTKEEMAEKLKIDFDAYISFEKGDTVIGVGFLINFERHTGISFLSVYERTLDLKHTLSLKGWYITNVNAEFADTLVAQDFKLSLVSDNTDSKTEAA